jgi:RNA polymerase sigma-70 factor (ECF subfamily)
MNDDLIQQAKAGDQAAFAQVVHNYQGFVNSLSRCYLSPGEVKDAAQLIWLTVWQKLHQLEEPAKFPAWLKQLVFYRCLNFRKARAARQDKETTLAPETWSALADIISDSQDVAATLEQRELRRIISRELDRLPGEYGLLLRLYYLKDLPYRAISQATGLPQSTLKWRLHQARSLLRGRLARLLQHEISRRNDQ